MEKYKSFILGAALAAIVGYYTYSKTNGENELLRSKLREQKIETTNKEMEALEFLMQVTETEKQNITHYNEIVDTTKRYSKLVFEDAKNGNYENIHKIVMMHRKLEQCSNKILANNKYLYESIRQYIEPQSLEGKEF